MRRILTSAALAAALTLGAAACTSPTAPAPQPKDSTSMAQNPSCTSQGGYALRQSAHAVFPALPKHPEGAEKTPSGGIYTVNLTATPATASITFDVEEPAPGQHLDFKDAKLGDELEFWGYRIKITSICQGEVRFDVLKHP